MFPPNFYRPVWAEINHTNLSSNFLALSRFAGGKLSYLLVIKANGYGHGMVQVARTLSKHHPKFFGVSSVEEALELKKAGVKVPPLILGNIYPFTNLIPAIESGTRVTVASLDSARMCEQYARKMGKQVFVHAKVDTGMSRIGVNVSKGLEFIEKIQGLSSVVLEGVYTHFSGSAEDPEFTRRQHELFVGLLAELKQRGIRIPYIHCANSAAFIKYPAFYHNLVRLGISLYGVCPVTRGKVPNLKPVLSWKSRIIFLKQVPAGTPVSYASTFRTKRRSKIATAAFGYADGYRRSFSNKGMVLVNGRKVPVLGRVTMDMTMLDVTGLPEVHVGDEVTILGKQGAAEVSVQDLAQWAGTSAYEIFCGIAARVPRVAVQSVS